VYARFLSHDVCGFGNLAETSCQHRWFGCEYLYGVTLVSIALSLSTAQHIYAKQCSTIIVCAALLDSEHPSRSLMDSTVSEDIESFGFRAYALLRTNAIAELPVCSFSSFDGQADAHRQHPPNDAQPSVRPGTPLRSVVAGAGKQDHAAASDSSAPEKPITKESASKFCVHANLR
jgi:hypothetical protein